MKNKFLNKNLITKIINKRLINLPSPSNISSIWNLGSILGICLLIQIITGLFLTIHYCANIELAFRRVSHICRNVNYGWLIRTIHANGASLFFFSLYIHIGRGLYYRSYNLKETWIVGVTIFLLTIATAFLGYVLPWGQISFWGATVITNLLSAIPYLGKIIVEWIWGGFSIDNATLTRFYTFHFFTPFLIIRIIFIHLIFLHKTGSSNPLGSTINIDKIPFHPFFSIKDLLGIFIFIFIFIIITLKTPYFFSDPDNFSPANPLITPIHIQPEWYFLFAYAILRSIPNKLGGVIALLISIFILYIIPFFKYKKFSRNQFYPINKLLFWIFVSIFFLLTWIGARPVEEPFIYIGQWLTCSYFIIFFFNQITFLFWDKFLFKFF